MAGAPFPTSGIHIQPRFTPFHATFRAFFRPHLPIESLRRASPSRNIPRLARLTNAPLPCSRPHASNGTPPSPSDRLRRRDEWTWTEVRSMYRYNAMGTMRVRDQGSDRRCLSSPPTTAKRCIARTPPGICPPLLLLSSPLVDFRLRLRTHPPSPHTLTSRISQAGTQCNSPEMPRRPRLPTRPPRRPVAPSTRGAVAQGPAQKSAQAMMSTDLKSRLEHARYCRGPGTPGEGIWQEGPLIGTRCVSIPH